MMHRFIFLIEGRDKSMRKQMITLAVLVVMFFCDAKAFAVEEQEAIYVNGTMQTIKPGTAGKWVMTSETALEFYSSAGGFSIPYARIRSYQFREEAKIHLGILAAGAVSLVKKRAKNHFVTITWKDGQGTEEGVTLEIAKTAPKILQPLFDARASQSCQPRSGQICKKVD